MAFNSPSDAPGPSSQPNPGSMSGGDDYSPSMMAGGPQIPGQSADDQSDKMASVLQRTRDLQMQLQDLASQFPIAAAEVRQAVSAIQAIVQKIVSTPEEAEPPSPQMLG